MVWNEKLEHILTMITSKQKKTLLDKFSFNSLELLCLSDSVTVNKVLDHIIESKDKYNLLPLYRLLHGRTIRETAKLVGFSAERVRNIERMPIIYSNSKVRKSLLDLYGIKLGDAGNVRTRKWND